jgi:hypothetical protein
MSVNRNPSFILFAHVLVTGRSYLNISMATAESGVEGRIKTYGLVY